jgi:hypothetical protein
MRDSCPNATVLERAALGLLPDSEAEPIRRHLLECESCAHALASRPTEDERVRPLRSVPDSSGEREGVSPGGISECGVWHAE